MSGGLRVHSLGNLKRTTLGAHHDVARLTRDLRFDSYADSLI